MRMTFFFTLRLLRTFAKGRETRDRQNVCGCVGAQTQQRADVHEIKGKQSTGVDSIQWKEGERAMSELFDGDSALYRGPRN